MPYVAHKRLVTVIHMPYHTVYHGGSLIPIRVHARVRPSVLAAEINRIRNLTRPSTESYTEKYLQSKDHIYFDDEAREIRARVDSLLRRVHVFIPRAAASDFAEEIVPERMRSGDYVRRLISGKNNAKKDMIEPVSWYEVPDRGNFGNLSCVKYVAGKPQSVRKPYFKVADLRPSDIKNDVNFLSYYSKNREAAANASQDLPMTDRELRKARALQPDVDESTLRKAVKTDNGTESKAEKKRGSKREKAETKETKSEPAKAQALEPVKEPEPVKEAQPTPEAVKEPEPVKEPELAKEPEAVVEPKPEPVTEPVAETPQEPQPAAVEEPMPVSELESKGESKPETNSEPQITEAVSESEETAEKQAADKNVRQDKEEAVKRIEQYLVKAAEEARSDEERKQAAEEERVKLEAEELKAWEALQAAQERVAHLDEIVKQEQAGAERQAEEEKIEAARLETERILEQERKLEEAKVEALLKEQERMIVEEQLEKVRQLEEKEERLANVTFGDADEVKDIDHSCDDVLTCDLTDQEREERPYDPVTDDDTRIEEEDMHEEEHFDMTEDPFVEEPDAAEGKVVTGGNAVEESTKIEEVTSGGEESFEWGNEDD
ncbi:Proteoglycan 4 [Eufriesea mexicana]|uniref:Proteoglycan 4 n=1 Tax=Eufriesea mexicana TaxID=516756 RepID=A0A310SMV7_9HYME|nr:Proteoglycan 4 [Eufriesea mexicana]